MVIEYFPPEPLNEKHDVSHFDSKNNVLDHWLKNRAVKNEKRNATRTFVLQKDNKVIGYYSLAVGSIQHIETPSSFKRNMPDPIPVMILGRLAIDKNFQNKGLGSALLKDAALKTLQISKTAGIKAMIVHAINQKALQFYQARGFTASPINRKTLMISIKELSLSL